ncbi:MAG TPA: AI-2E family transporter [Accumulibacter sp.]|nr:AI-2E family transporter [Accumulibacter sp.]HMW17668.1 AI-2E family transporter [Accumulibacter sp.]HMX22076.1 AI-2E family transporter [Accumulibacter sp.]HMY05752.1 AI-2E family transporter [Accumulibacter sp.]HNC16570.1 AI-2E family transporter [Accumulibacter sp.]
MNKLPVASPHSYAAWILAFVGMIAILHFKLLTALITGLLVYQLVHLIAPCFARHLPGMRARTLAIGLVVMVIIGAISAAVVGLSAFMHSEGGSFAALLTKMAEIIDSTRSTLPAWLADLLPRDVTALRERVSAWLREHSSELQVIGKETGHTAAHMLIGMVIGGMVSLQESDHHDSLGPLGSALSERVARLAEAFRQVVFAQVRISALNTVFTTLYLAVALPLFGVHLPLTKTMIVVTFIAGLLPVVGNLISNTVIFVVSLAHSPGVAVTSLVYLIVIHKLEYFLNARIVGAEISAKPWEILTAMLVMESIFGLAGLVAAPICYAWLKDELVTRQLI